MSPTSCENVRGRRVWRSLLALTALAMLGACSGGLGDVCNTDHDCRAGLRCSAGGASRGVCVYADTLRDGPPLLDLLQPDQSIDLDASRDASRDGTGDTLRPDLPKDDTAGDGASGDSPGDGASGDSHGDGMTDSSPDAGPDGGASDGAAD